MSNPDVCQFDGYRRDIIHRDSDVIVRQCGWCGEMTSEHIVPDVKADLQREWQ